MFRFFYSSTHKHALRLQKNQKFVFNKPFKEKIFNNCVDMENRDFAPIAGDITAQVARLSTHLFSDLS